MEISRELPHLSYPKKAFKAGPLSRLPVPKLGSPYFTLTVFHHWIQILSGQWIPSGLNVEGFLRVLNVSIALLTRSHTTMNIGPGIFLFNP
jgi:hypothetical protein